VIFRPLEIAGLFLVEIEPSVDERGFFARTYCANTFAERGLAPCDEQWSLSGNALRGTLRGLHWQAAPHAETKLARCVRGAVFDVAVDLRPESPTLGHHVGVTLTAENRAGLYIPEGFAHGFLTLEDDSEILYGISPGHHPAAACGARWDSPRLAIAWPFAPTIVSERDQALPEWEA